MATIYARLINQDKFNYQTVVSARFDKQNEDIQVLSETQIFINKKFNRNLTESDIDKIVIKSSLENKNQRQETTDFGCRFDIINSRIKIFSQNYWNDWIILCENSVQIFN